MSAFFGAAEIVAPQFTNGAETPRSGRAQSGALQSPNPGQPPTLERPPPLDSPQPWTDWMVGVSSGVSSHRLST
ncbi:hypothetical protein P7K49_020327 [Saguinus oedipus]|uniref:Uncharacterized protein n=1 Tax=Saguinus oedipus TaxID=9490 RepID=A0ABQ9V0U9_SAGOE|nr:hypothetical protein P7K49_020327 [Saguinus oedipus]